MKIRLTHQFSEFIHLIFSKYFEPLPCANHHFRHWEWQGDCVAGSIICWLSRRGEKCGRSGHRSLRGRCGHTEEARYSEGQLPRAACVQGDQYVDVENADGEMRRGKIFIRTSLEAVWTIVCRTAKLGRGQHCPNGLDRKRWAEAGEMERRREISDRFGSKIGIWV